MVRMAATNRSCTSIASFVSKWQPSTSNSSRQNRFLCFTIRASQSTDGKNKVYKELDALVLKGLACKTVGFFSLRKIEDAVIHAENTAPAALDLEEARRIKQEEMMREYDLWNYPTKSNEILADLAGSVKVVDALKDLRYKASVDVSKFLDQYEMSKLLKGPYDMDGARIVIEAGSEGIYPEVSLGALEQFLNLSCNDVDTLSHEQLLNMYTKWAEKQGNLPRVVEKHCSGNGIKSATVEFEFQYALATFQESRVFTAVSQLCLLSVYFDAHACYVLLIIFGGIHPLSNLIVACCLGCLASVDVIPMFLETASDVDIDDKYLLVSYREEQGNTQRAVFVQHIPTGITTSSSGERSRFANKMKALNRLKAKLLVIARGPGVSNTKNISMDNIINTWNQETRKYVFHPFELVQDVKTGIQVPDLNSILDVNIEPLIVAHINTRQANDTV
ncbi:hypothetical protein RJ641_027140 [Dillenia turbinata]|uniref:Prokaryotic-type class I peptide chain release factors domain-containing protein n=1 Tax=Dillenia turbinata TaxID=194707 RepID=A0AAN8ZPD5_9MAGN